LVENVCSDGQVEGKIRIFCKKFMEINDLEIDEDTINDSFVSTNNLFDNFRILSSEIFTQVSEIMRELTQNFLK
jgi:hypothetical protein